MIELSGRGYIFTPSWRDDDGWHAHFHPRTGTDLYEAKTVRKSRRLARRPGHDILTWIPSTNGSGDGTDRAATFPRYTVRRSRPDKRTAKSDATRVRTSLTIHRPRRSNGTGYRTGDGHRAAVPIGTLGPVDNLGRSVAVVVSSDCSVRNGRVRVVCLPWDGRVCIVVRVPWWMCVRVTAAVLL